jgi:MYXO-CTERM domain-containing protein
MSESDPPRPAAFAAVAVLALVVLRLLYASGLGAKPSTRALMGW